MKPQFAIFILLLSMIWSATDMTAIAVATENRPAPIRVGVPADVLDDYRLYLGTREPLAITDYGGHMSRRDVVELILFQQALALGGDQSEIFIVEIPNYERIVTEIREGRLAGSGTSIWDTDLETTSDLFFVTDAVIENGQFEAGLYTAPDNTKAKDARNLKDIQKLSAVSNRNWIPDWLTLNALGLKGIRHIQDWKTMVRNVANRRADFLLAPFQQTDDMRLQVDSMTLIPIRGVKVGLIGSRHFAISKHYPDSERIFAALQRGVEIMKTRGTFQKAYRQSGFFNPNVKDWLQLDNTLSAPHSPSDESDKQ